MQKTVNVTFNGAFVGTAKVDEDSGIFEIELEDDDIEILFPAHKDLSFGFTDVEHVDVLPPYPQWDIDLSAAYYKNRPKGTFDA